MSTTNPTQEHSNHSAAQELGRQLNIDTIGGNKVDMLINGERIFPAMLDAINGANSEICFETFIYWSGDIAQEFAAALASASRRGVAVYILLDWWGAFEMSPELIEQMESAGARVRYFNPLRWWQLHRLNYRTHRKILVVDRKLAFTGGVGIAEQWQGDARNADEWHDFHYRVQGPSVRQFQQAFELIWSEVLEESPLEAAPDVADPPGPDTPIAVQVLASSPRQGAEKSYRAFQYAITTAKSSILLTTAYFVPDEETSKLLVGAAQRGVDVQVMIPGEHNDQQLARFASKASWGELLQAGVTINIYQATMLHAKAMVIDDSWVMVGSANFDIRSFALNDEINMHVFDRGFAAQHRQVFEQDLRLCKAMGYEEWCGRGLWCKTQETFSNMFRSQL